MQPGCGIKRYSLLKVKTELINSYCNNFEMKLWIIAAIVLSVILSAAVTLSLEAEFCQWEDLSVTCDVAHVVVVTQALYGRMRLGRCVERSFGHVDCYKDVLSVVKSACTGKSSCSFNVGALLHSDFNSCPKDLTAYLAVQYTCVPVVTCGESMCSSSTAPPIPRPVGYIANSIEPKESCGSARCPYNLYTSPGRRFNVSATVFRARADKDNVCRTYAIVYESGRQSSELMSCGRTELDDKVVYTSTTSHLSVVMYGASGPEGMSVLLKYQEVGCADIVAPPYAELKRTPESLSVACAYSTQKWHLTCNGIDWVGTIGTCSEPEVSHVRSSDAAIGQAGTSTLGILVIVGLGVALGVAIGVFFLCVVVYIMKRRSRLYVEAQRHQTALRADDVGIYGLYHKDNTSSLLPPYDGSHECAHQSQWGMEHNYQSTLHPTRDQRKEVNANWDYPFMGNYSGSTGSTFREHIYEQPNFTTKNNTDAHRITLVQAPVLAVTDHVGSSPTADNESRRTT